MLSLARAGIRRRLGSLAAIALVVAVGTGTSVAAFEAAERTQRAYPRYLRDADVGDLVFNTSLSTRRAAEILASTPGVAEVVSDDFLIATIDDGAPRTQAAVDGGTLQTRMSAEGRYERQDRPVVHEGRMIRSGREAFLSSEAADAFDLEVGDEIPLAFWAPSSIYSGRGPDEASVGDVLHRD